MNGRLAYGISSVLVVVLAGAVGVVQADWDPGDPYKWVQLPDETPTGIDVRLDSNDGTPRRLGDDFLCTKTGPITDVHFWCSWQDDFVGQIEQMRVAFYADIPAAQSPTGYSMPNMDLGPLWERYVTPAEFTMRLYKDISPDWEWFGDPLFGWEFLQEFGDQQIYQVNILFEGPDYFIQQGTDTNPIVYWLVIDDVLTLPQGTFFGWKTSPDHWNDDGVYWDEFAPFPWQELIYPFLHPLAGQSIDLSFVITEDEAEPKEPLIEFSLDIGSDKELSDPNFDGDEGFDPGDVYIWQGPAVTPPAVPGGRDGFKDDALIFPVGDPFPDPPDLVLPPATAVPVGNGDPQMYNDYFDLDGHDQLDISLIQQFDLQGQPLSVPIPAFPSACIWSPEFMSISFDDDTREGWPVADVPVTKPSPAGLSSYGSSAGRDEVIGTTLLVGAAPPFALAPGSPFPIADEAMVHMDLAPNPDGVEQQDDDVDSLDVVPDPGSAQPNCPFWYFTPDHEATLGLDPGDIYEVFAGGGFALVIDDVLNLGIPDETDVDAFEFAFLDIGQGPTFVVLFSVDEDDPLTPGIDESGSAAGLLPDVVYASSLTGAPPIPVTDPLGDDIDAIMLWCEQLPEAPEPTLVVARQVFYNDSDYDGFGVPSAGLDPDPPNPNPFSDDDDAIDPIKSPLLPGAGQAVLANYTNFTKGITGVMVDVVNATAPPTLADFTFTDIGRTGGLVGEIPVVLAPDAHLVRALPGGGANDYRCVFSFSTLQDTWLRVDVGTGFGLPAVDTHWWGNARGECNSVQFGFVATVNVTDELAIRANPDTAFPPIVLGSPIALYDINKDTFSNSSDELFVRSNYTIPANAVYLITR